MTSCVEFKRTAFAVAVWFIVAPLAAPVAVPLILLWARATGGGDIAP